MFASHEAYVARKGDAAFWAPLLRPVVGDRALVPGRNPTYPTFVAGDVVVKLFGFRPRWRAAHAAETAASTLLRSDDAIPAPRVLDAGALFDGAEQPWPYLVLQRVPGAPGPVPPAELGALVKRIHALAPADRIPRLDPLPDLDVRTGAERSSLPAHLVAQAEDYVAALPAPDPVFVHGDLCGQHVFVDGDRIAGFIDWGDALVADRHYELIQIHRDAFDCDTRRLARFLDAAAWPVDADFARRALGWALVRQATGIRQHDTMDVFEPVAARFDLRSFRTLDDLAGALFEV